MLGKKIDAVHQGGHAHQCDGQRCPAVAGIAAQIGPFPPGGLTQLQGQFRLFVQIARGVLEGLDVLPGLGGDVWLLLSGQLPLPLRQALFHIGADQLDLRMGLLQTGQQLVHLLLVFEIALLLLSAVVLHH